MFLISFPGGFMNNLPTLELLWNNLDNYLIL